MSLLISDEEKKAFQSAIIGLLSSVPIGERLNTLSDIVDASYKLHYSSNSKLYTKPQSDAFNHAVEQWLIGENPYKIDFGDALKLDAKSKKEINRLLKQHLEMGRMMKQMGKMGGMKGLGALLGGGGMPSPGDLAGGAARDGFDRFIDATV
ncbi:MAG: hypothetical protein P1V97_39345, partial [Planctomycetota bacterium]|nr:hypothetical protein [Planctomycetota bacterium]